MPDTIVYTITDEAPALATYSLLPIVRAFTKSCGVEVTTENISLAARILAQFPEKLKVGEKSDDALTALGQLANTPAANIIKLPNISASIPQLNAAIAELQKNGYAIPNYPSNPQTEAEKEIQGRYAKVLGSAVNPVLREGNSDRRVAAAVKAYARKHPHSMGVWKTTSRSRVANMIEGDFYGSEKSVAVAAATKVKIELIGNDGTSKVLKPDLALKKDEVIDASVLSAMKLEQFLQEQIKSAKEEDLLFSIHLKATMMKVSDPVIFGHAVKVFFSELFDKHKVSFEKIGFNPNNGIGDLENRIADLPDSEREAIKLDLKALYETRPKLAMVNSDKGITNLHVPSDVIVDASMPAAIRTSGQMWGPDGKPKDTLFVIPDRCYSGVYQATIDFCKTNGAFDVKTMGNVSNVGLMAQKAEEYGSHDKTFVIPCDGVVKVTAENGEELLSHQVFKGDIWRMCQTKDEPIRDWVRLAVQRARSTNQPAIFWLDPNRAHDVSLISKVETYLKDHDTQGLEIKILSPIEATLYSCERLKAGLDTISVTGNVLRDYLTDLFPILELGTSSKMLSIVPLLKGGGLYETGAGGSAPKHVQQFLEEGHLRWDSLGEFLALGVSFEDLAEKTNNQKLKVVAKALEKANCDYLEHDRSPSRTTGELDNRGSHFYLAQYWAKALAEQNEDAELKQLFSAAAKQLCEQESTIVNELNAAQNRVEDIGGYYYPDVLKTEKAMRPSITFNKVIDALLT